MVFMALKSKVYKEFAFPNVDNTDHKVFIDKDIFGIKSSFYIIFESINRRWSVVAQKGCYEVIHHKNSVSRVDFSGKNMITIKTVYGDILNGIAIEEESDFANFGKYDISGISEITVGKGTTNTICYDFNNLISQHHCTISLYNRSHYLYDTSSNGVFVNNKKVSSNVKLMFGDIVEIYGLKLVYLNDIIAISSVVGNFRVSSVLPVYEQPESATDLVRLQHQDYFFHRSPRFFPDICRETVVVEAPTNSQITKKKSLLLTIGPSFTMAIPMILGCVLMILSANASGGKTSAFMFTGLVTSFGSAILGALWAFLNIRETNRKEQEDEDQRFNMYSNYLLQMSDYIKEKYKQNFNALYELYPSASQCCTYSRASAELWNRNISHTDFLYHRLGIGNTDFHMDIQVPAEKFSMTYDSLKDKPRLLRDNFKVLTNIPVGVDFSSSNLFGIIGEKANVRVVVNSLIAQIAATTCYTDAKIVFCSKETFQKDTDCWSYIKWLPHIWSESRDMRYFATNKQETSEVLFELSNIIRQRASMPGSSFTEKTSFRPHYFLFITDVSLLEDELISKYVFDKKADLGITTFLMSDSYTTLPNTCDNILEYSQNFSGYYDVQRGMGEAMPIEFDKVSQVELMSFAKRISSLKVKEVEDDTSIVQSLSFFDMYNVSRLEEFNIKERWRKSQPHLSMKALIGKKAGFADCYLDVHEKHHGPHGLIAGTTGSGKSEIIQTFMLSLALNFSPDDIAFFVIDFKGGGMANLFEGLPHMAGQISNLSGNQITRAMVSIKSENLRRQRIFSEFGVNNINLYTQLYKNSKAPIPIPHLLIIIDEFAELKKEEPEFMRELISVAQVGRSLGVHLILATQKPSGTVDDNIWSNAKFRLCLRVQDRQDSQDMLHKPDAAHITQAGRGYLQVGNDEIYELFQSGYSGAVYDEMSKAGKSEIATMITSTGKTALVGSHTKMKIKEQEKNRWYGFLCEEIRRRIDCDTDYDIESKDALAREVIASAIDRGFNIGMSNAEVRAVKNFIELMPQSNMSVQQAVEYISMRAVRDNIKLPEIKEKTQLEALVGYITKVAEEENYVQKARLWMPLLKSEIALCEISDINKLYNNGRWVKEEKWSLETVVGLYDDPHNQSQLPFTINFAEGGHLAVCGAVSSGKSTFIQTLVFSLAMRYTPEQFNFYLLDFSGGMLTVFEKLPHTGGVIKDNEFDKMSKFFNMISGIIEERKQRMAGGSYIQYVKSHRDEAMPAIVIAIDNFAGFKEKTENAYENILIQLSREGVGYGVFLVLSSAGFGLSEIQNRIGDNIRTVVSLEMSDKFKYMDVLRTTRVEVMPELGVKGRGIGFVENRLLEFQTALAVSANNDYERNIKIEKICESMDENWDGRRARAIPQIPDKPVYENISVLDEYVDAAKSDKLIPFAYKNNDATVYSIDLTKTFCYCVTGKSRTGKTNVLKLLMLALRNKDAGKVVIEKNLSELRNLCNDYDFRFISTDSDILNYFQEITPDFVERNQYKKELQSQGLGDEEIFEKMLRFKPIYIFISDLNEFIDGVYHPQGNIGNMSGFFENIFEKGYLHNIFFFACVNTDEATSMAGIKAYQAFIYYKTGVHLGGNTAAQRVFNFQNIHYTQMTKQAPKGEGLVPCTTDETIGEKIIIPLVGGKSI